MNAVLADEATFERLVEQHRRELHVHCYRMLASFHEAEDAVQETLLRAWRARDTFEGEDLVRAWLYRIATNVCLDLIRSKSRRVTELQSCAEISWLTPYPDRLLDELGSDQDEPEVVAVARETIELAFLAALQVLPPKQRAALLLRDVLGMPAAETAALLETSVPAANSALQRARAMMQKHLPSHRSEWKAPQSSAQDRALLERFVDAHQRYDTEAALAAVTNDIRITMPPYPMCFDGIEALMPLVERAIGPDREGEWRLLPTMANRMPAAASYLLRPGDTEYRAFKLDVMRVEDGLIAEITTFGPDLFDVFELPMVLSQK